jgi:invasion protein IalB
MTTNSWSLPVLPLLFAAVFSLPAMAQAQQQPPAAAPRPAAPRPAQPAPANPAAQATLLGQFGDWGAYTATPGGRKVCFALAKPSSATTDPPGRKRDQSYLFVSTRPADRVKNEISVIVGYSQRPNVDASASIGPANFVMYTQNDGAWIKNAADEAQMIDAMRKGADVVIKSVSGQGTKTTDTFSLKGISQALDRVAQECN